MTFVPLLDNAKKYIGAKELTVPEISTALVALVGKYGKQIYNDSAKLQQAMQEIGLPWVQYLQVSIMTQVSGFRELLECNDRTSQADLNRYIHNAVAETGLHQEMVLELAGAIALSLNIAVPYNMKDQEEWEDQTETVAYVVPMAAYAAELEQFERKYGQLMKEAVETGGETAEIGEHDLERLDILIRAGVTKAKYYKGLLLLSTAKITEEPAEGLRLLEEAAREGDSAALLALGDYYYNIRTTTSWNDAYIAYTGPGTGPLNQHRRKAVSEIITHRAYVKKMLEGCVLLSVLLLAVLVIAPASGPLFGPHRVLGTFFTLTAVACTVAAVLHYRIRPLDMVYWIPAGMFILWSLYMLARVML